MQALTAPSTLSDAAGVLAARAVAARRAALPHLADAAQVYAASVAWEGLLRPIVHGLVPAGSGMAGDFAAKTATFVAAEMALGRLLGVPAPSLMQSLLVNAGGLGASQLAQPMLFPRVSPAVAAAAAKPRA